MRGQGITDDIGFFHAGRSTHEHFGPERVQRELRIIRDGVHCTAHRAVPRADLDLASYGVVRVLEGRCCEAYPDMPWEPKLAFTALANYHRG